jgi:hypothetical protein
MADLCQQCSLELFGHDFHDLAGIGDAVPVICEGCGPKCIVNIEGVCTAPDCHRRHGETK